MDEHAFQTWMEEVTPVMTQLSVKQTETFFAQFINSCSRTQRWFLEKEFFKLMTQDFMTLPDVIVDKILGYLDTSSLLSLCLVCKSWKKHITTNTRLWASQCRQLPVIVDPTHTSSPTYLFRFFIQTQRVLRRMASGKAFETVHRHVNRSLPCQYPTSCEAFYGVGYSQGILVIGCKDTLYAVEDKADSSKVLWMQKTGLSSCLCVRSNFVFSGNSVGKINTVSLDGSFCPAFQCGANSITAIDVHESSQFLIAGSIDGSVRLVDGALQIIQLHVNTEPQPVGSFRSRHIRQVFFFPDRSLGTNQLAVCVCTDHVRVVAVVTPWGHVVHQEMYEFKTPVASLCRCFSEPYVLFITTAVDFDVASNLHSPSGLEMHSFEISSSGISSCVWRVDIGENQPQTSVYHKYDTVIDLLAAGRQLAIAVIDDSLHVFRIHCGTSLSEMANFFADERLRGLHIGQSPRGLAANVDWLNGLSPSSPQDHTPILLFSSLNQRTAELELTYLVWAADVWGAVRDKQLLEASHTKHKETGRESVDANEATGRTRSTGDGEDDGGGSGCGSEDVRGFGCGDDGVGHSDGVDDDGGGDDGAGHSDGVDDDSGSGSDDHVGAGVGHDGNHDDKDGKTEDEGREKGNVTSGQGRKISFISEIPCNVQLYTFEGHGMPN